MITKQSSKTYFRVLSILHLGLLAGQIFFGAIAFFIIKMGLNSLNSNLTNIFLLVNVVIITSCLFVGNLIYKKKIQGLKKEIDLKIKMTSYKGIMIIRLAFIEGPAFFSICSALVTGNFIFFLPAVLLIFFFILWRPNKQQIINDLELNDEEISLVNNSDAIIAEYFID